MKTEEVSFTHLLTERQVLRPCIYSKHLNFLFYGVHAQPPNKRYRHWSRITKLYFDWTTQSKTLPCVTVLEAIWQLPWAVWANPQLIVHQSILPVFRRKQGASWSQYLVADPRFKMDNSLFRQVSRHSTICLVSSLLNCNANASYKLLRAPSKLIWFSISWGWGKRMSLGTFCCNYSLTKSSHWNVQEHERYQMS